MCPLADINIGGMSPLFFAGSVIVLGGGMASGELPVPKPDQPSLKGVRCFYSMLSKGPLSHLLKVYVFGIFSGMLKLA